MELVLSKPRWCPAQAYERFVHTICQSPHSKAATVCRFLMKQTEVETALLHGSNASIPRQGSLLLMHRHPGRVQQPRPFFFLREPTHYVVWFLSFPTACAVGSQLLHTYLITYALMRLQLT